MKKKSFSACKNHRRKTRRFARSIKFLKDCSNNSCQTVSKVPNDETLQAMRDVESGKNYEDVTIELLK